MLKQLRTAVLIFAWWACGATGFAYTWTLEHDFKIRDAIFMMFIGWGGPFIWPMGACIHSDIDDHVLWEHPNGKEDLHSR